MNHTNPDTEQPHTAFKALLYLLNHEAFVGCLLFLMLLFGQRDTINLPYHWDAMASVFDYSDAILNHKLWPFPKLEWNDPGHPPFYYEVLAVAWMLGGQRTTVAHYVGLTFAWLALFYTYLFGRNLLESSLAGFLAAVLLLFNPLSFAQLGDLNNEVPFTALLIMSTYYLALDRRGSFILCASACALTKAYATPFVAVIIGLRLLLFDRNNITLRRLLYLAIPLLLYAVWFALHFYFTGILLNAARWAHTREVYSTIGGYWNSFQARFHYHFLEANWLISLGCLPAFVLAWPRSARLSSPIYLLAGSLVVDFLLLCFMKQYIPRYVMVIYPYLFLLGAVGITRLLEARRQYLRVLGLVVVALSLSTYAAQHDQHRPGYGSFEENSEYLDVILLNMDVCRYIEDKYPDKIILTTWPLLRALSNPTLGYVSRAVQVAVSPTEHYDLFLFMPYTSGQDEELLSRWRRIRDLRMENPVLLKRFERNGKVVELYQRP